MPADMYFFHFQKGMDAFHAGHNETARISFLKSARLLYQLAKEAPDPAAQQNWLTRARRVQDLALQLETGQTSSKPAKKPVSDAKKSKSVPASREPEKSEDSSRWELTERPDVTFADIAGLDSVKELIQQRVIFPLRNPEIAAAYNRRAGAGIMMYGPPGTGKTMMAKAIAGEMNLPFFTVQSSSILSKWVGDAEQNLRDLFQKAREKAPSVLFFDEAEALLCKRGGNSTVMNRVIPEFLAQVDGVSKGSEELLLIGATNRPWDLDPAAVRTGRFGEKIYIPLPDAAAREFLLRQKLGELPGVETINFSELVEKTEGYSGADINGLVYRIIDPAFVRAVQMGTQVPIQAEDVQTALAETSPSVTEKDLAEFEKYRKEIQG
ncbi:MAG: ATP-binding protein [Planctomycetia bacterium]|nr:ATP-binding protein [Planctomycetia bacterium]